MTQKRSPFAMVSLEIISDDRLSKMQLRVLMALLSFRNKNHDMVWPHRATLSEICGYPPKVISRVTTDLCKLGYLEKTGKGGFGKPCLYRITAPYSGAVDDTTTFTESVSSTALDSVPEQPPNRDPAKKRPRTDNRTYHSMKRSLSSSTTNNSVENFAARITDRSWAEESINIVGEIVDEL